MKIKLFFLTFAIAYVVGDSGLLNSRIIGGEPMTSRDSLFIVSLQRNEKLFCAGVIYNLRIIVTTATCIDGKNMNEISVLAGARSLSESGKRFGVDNIIKKKSFGPRNIRDNIALLHTTGNMYQGSLRWGTLQDVTVEKEGISVNTCGWGENKVIYDSINKNL